MGGGEVVFNIINELPMTNPQVVTEKLIEAGLVEVTVCED